MFLLDRTMNRYYVTEAGVPLKTNLERTKRDMTEM
jgi:hypothetical protein